MIDIEYAFRLSRAGFRRYILPCFDPLIAAAGHLNRLQPAVGQCWSGADPVARGDRIAIYVHFDRCGRVHDYVLYQLRELADAGFAIVFITNSPEFPEPSRDRVTPWCRTVVWRHNVGYDFGAYKDGMDFLGELKQLDTLVLMNDSIYGPFWKLSDVLDSINRAVTDFWGITESLQHSRHIQSYFMLFFPAALRSEAFARFWRSVPYVNNKGWVIRNCEIRLSRVLEGQKLRGHALAPYGALVHNMIDKLSKGNWSGFPQSQRLYYQHLADALSKGRPINPMHSFWKVLIDDFRCPFIKRELINANPAHVPQIAQWPSVIKERSDYDVSLIETHLSSLRAHAG